MDVLAVLLMIGAVLISIPLGAGFAALTALALFGPAPGDEPVAYLIGAAVLVGLGLATLAVGLHRQRGKEAQPATPERAGASS